jgi:hypothetical protein
MKTMQTIFEVSIPDYLHFLQQLRTRESLQSVTYVLGRTNARVMDLAQKKLGFNAIDIGPNKHLLSKRMKDKKVANRYLMFAHKDWLLEQEDSLSLRYSGLVTSLKERSYHRLQDLGR